MSAHRCLAAGNIISGVLLPPSAMVSGVFPAPVRVAGPLRMIHPGVRLRRPTERLIALPQKTRAVFLVAAGFLCAYGIVSLRDAGRSPEEGGGLPGAFSRIPLAQGCLPGVAGASSLRFGAIRKYESCPGRHLFRNRRSKDPGTKGSRNGCR